MRKAVVLLLIGLAFAAGYVFGLWHETQRHARWFRQHSESIVSRDETTRMSVERIQELVKRKDDDG